MCSSFYLGLYAETLGLTAVTSLSVFYSADSLAPEHLSKDAAGTPDVHWCGITRLQQDLRRPVPQGHHLNHTQKQILYPETYSCKVINAQGLVTTGVRAMWQL